MYLPLFGDPVRGGGGGERRTALAGKRAASKQLCTCAAALLSAKHCLVTTLCGVRQGPEN